MLGLIAGLTVPSIVASVERSRNRAILKEAFQTISAITQEGVLNGDFANITDWDLVNSNSPTGIVGYLTSKINYSKQCLSTDTTSEGCKTEWLGGASSAHNARWILPNGARLQAERIGRFTSSYLLWTVTSSAYKNNPPILAGPNQDTVLITSNISDSTQNINGNMIRSGMCGAWDNLGWTDNLNAGLGYT